MVNRLSLVTAAAVALAMSPVAQPAAVNQILVGDSKIIATSVMPVSRVDSAGKSTGTVLEVQMKYYAVGPGVELKGFGVLKGNGELTALLSGPALTFRDLGSATRLQRMELKPTGVPAGPNGRELPDDSAFTTFETFDCPCSDAADVFTRVNNALNRYFPDGTTPKTDDPPYRRVSTFRRLPAVAPPYVGKVAVQVEYPVTLQTKGLGFRLWHVVVESRVKSATDVPAVTEAITNAANDFLKTFVAEIRK